MTDIRQDLAKTAEDVARVAKEAAYVAIGIGVLGFHKAQVRRQELADAAERANRGDLDASLGEARKQVAKRVKDFDDTVGQVIKMLDSTLRARVAAASRAGAGHGPAGAARHATRSASRIFTFAA